MLDPDAEPIAVLGDGERVVIDTEDSVCGLAKARAPGGMHIDEVLETLGGACPLTGPFAVEGARRGDVLEVEIHRVDAAPGAGDGLDRGLRRFRGAVAPSSTGSRRTSSRGCR